MEYINYNYSVFERNGKTFVTLKQKGFRDYVSSFFDLSFTTPSYWLRKEGGGASLKYETYEEMKAAAMHFAANDGAYEEEVAKRTQVQHQLMKITAATNIGMSAIAHAKAYAEMKINPNLVNTAVVAEAETAETVAAE